LNYLNKIIFRRFDIYLKKDVGPLADNFEIEIRSGPGHTTSQSKEKFSSNFYSGFVEDELKSHVLCYFEKQSDNIYADPDDKLLNTPLIYLQIHIVNETENTIYYIEPLVDKLTQEVKYIAYKSEDIDSDVSSNGVFK
jgi:hypothetical protein